MTDRFDAAAHLRHRMANVRTERGTRLFAEFEQALLDVEQTAGEFGLLTPVTTDDLVQDGLGQALQVVLDAAEESPDRASWLDLEQASFAPVVTRPQKIVCVGFNYAKHAAETHTTVGDVPALFIKVNSALNNHQGVVLLPSGASWFDYETELVVIIGSRARNLARGDALAHVAGYTVGNDLSARDLQMATSQFTAGKIFDGSAPVGPWLTPRALIDDPNQLTLQTTVNGETRQDWNTNDMIFDVPWLVSYVSSVCTLFPGDLLFTGTPQGVILGQTGPMERRRWLRPGDRITSRLEGLGELAVTMR